MAQLLSGKEYAQIMKQDMKNYIATQQRSDCYIAVLFFGDNKASDVYTKMKKKYGNSVGIQVAIVGQEKQYATDEILVLIEKLNYDEKCLGIMVQLPLPDYLQKDKAAIMSVIAYQKDIDGLGGVAFGKAIVQKNGFMPATPAAVMGLMKYHNIAVSGKIVAVVGQSDLVGSPLTTILMQEGACVFSCNEHANQQLLKQITQKADIIISCTGVVHLIDETYVAHDKTQIIIDVGYGQKDGKPAGDINPGAIDNLVKAYSPVPGGIGPLTIAHLFHNMILLKKLY